MIEIFTANPVGMAAIGAAIAIAMTGIAAGYAEGGIGQKAIEKGCLEGSKFGKGLILIVIPETIIILGFVVALFIVMG
jgi:V/A-type H+-transporting ATPase subunit K